MFPMAALVRVLVSITATILHVIDPRSSIAETVRYFNNRVSRELIGVHNGVLIAIMSSTETVLISFALIQNMS